MFKKKKLRRTNAEDFITNGQTFQVFEDKVKVVDCYFPKKKWSDEKKEELIIQRFSDFLFLNAGIDQETASDKLFEMNEIACINPIELNSLIKIFNDTFKQPKTATAKKLRTVIFSSDCGYSRKMKRAKTAKIIGKLRTDKTLNMLQGLTENYTGEEPMTISLLSKLSGKHRNTISKYYNKIMENNTKKEKEEEAIQRQIRAEKFIKLFEEWAEVEHGTIDRMASQICEHVSEEEELVF